MLIVHNYKISISIHLNRLISIFNDIVDDKLIIISKLNPNCKYETIPLVIIFKAIAKGNRKLLKQMTVFIWPTAQQLAKTNQKALKEPEIK